MPKIPSLNSRIYQQPRTERYVDVDDDGQEEYHRPKWTKPGSDFQRELLHAVGRKYYLKRDERSQVIAIEKGMMSLAETRIASRYPREWIDRCMSWARDMRRKGTPIKLSSLINLINNADRRADFISEWTRKNGTIISDEGTTI